jgi:FKBP-type peptidyl-prolyl cis-trans isomerase 2
MGQAKNGDQVKVHFIGKTENGDIFSSSHGQEPLAFKIGDGTVLPGVDQAVLGMLKGEKKTVTVPPHDGFGEQNESLILTVDRSHFPEDFEPKEGMELQLPQANGGIVFIKILKLLENNQIKLDANHPLAGKTLTFELELLEIA